MNWRPGTKLAGSAAVAGPIVPTIRPWVNVGEPNVASKASTLNLIESSPSVAAACSCWRNGEPPRSPHCRPVSTDWYIAPASSSPRADGQRSQMSMKAAGSIRAGQERRAGRVHEPDLEPPDLGDELLLGVQVHQLGRRPLRGVRHLRAEHGVAGDRRAAIFEPGRGHGARQERPVGRAAGVPPAVRRGRRPALPILGLERRIVEVGRIVVDRRWRRLERTGEMQAQCAEVAHVLPPSRARVRGRGIRPPGRHHTTGLRASYLMGGGGEQEACRWRANLRERMTVDAHPRPRYYSASGSSSSSSSLMAFSAASRMIVRSSSRA